MKNDHGQARQYHNTDYFITCVHESWPATINNKTAFANCFEGNVIKPQKKKKKSMDSLRLFSHDGKVGILNFNLKCAFWIKIRKTHFRSCVKTCQITSRNVIWNAHLKSRYRRVFQLRFSQITQRNLCMNDLTSKLCFGGGASVTFY